MNSYGLKSDVRKQAILIIFVLSVLLVTKLIITY